MDSLGIFASLVPIECRTGAADGGKLCRVSRHLGPNKTSSVFSTYSVSEARPLYSSSTRCDFRRFHFLYGYWSLRTSSKAPPSPSTYQNEICLWKFSDYWKNLCTLLVPRWMSLETVEFQKRSALALLFYSQKKPVCLCKCRKILCLRERCTCPCSVFLELNIESSSLDVQANSEPFFSTMSTSRCKSIFRGATCAIFIRW